MKTKNLLFHLWTILLCLPLLCACDDSNEGGGGDTPIWDFYPICFYFDVQDAEGNNLLSPLTEGNILNQDIKATYRGKEYGLNEPVADTKAYLARMYGLRTLETKDGHCQLCFGELQGEDTYENETLTLDWGDGTRDVITFSSRLTWKSPEDPEFDRHFFLNGVEQDGSQFSIVKERGTGPALSRSTWSIIDSNFYIEAEDKTDIHADLQGALYQIGCGLRIDLPAVATEGSKGMLAWMDADNWAIIGGKLSVKRAVNFSDFTPNITDKYQSYPPDDQIYAYMEWEANLVNDEVRHYDVFVVRTSSNSQALWIYEDLTEMYQAQYPDQQVDKVIRTLVGEMNSL